MSMDIVFFGSQDYANVAARWASALSSELGWQCAVYAAHRSTPFPAFSITQWRPATVVGREAPYDRAGCRQHIGDCRNFVFFSDTWEDIYNWTWLAPLDDRRVRIARLHLGSAYRALHAHEDSDLGRFDATFCGLDSVRLHPENIGMYPFSNAIAPCFTSVTPSNIAKHIPSGDKGPVTAICNVPLPIHSRNRYSRPRVAA